MKKYLFFMTTFLGLISFSLSAGNFTFIHISDTHAPTEQSKQTISRIKTLGKVDIIPYEMNSYSPAFIINTGDMTEFGEEGWSAYTDFWQGISIPHFNVLGNHDNTWSSNRDKLRAEFGAPYYSFDTYGCHFIILESAMTQDPLPGFGVEELNWLKEDLQKTERDRPIFLAFHHPLDSGEYISTYERYRLLEMFQQYNLICILVGHGHSARSFNFEGYDAVEGGSSFGDKPGFNIITLSNNTLYVAYWNANDSTARKGLLEKSVLKKKDNPNALISRPADGALIKDTTFEIRAVVYKFQGNVENALYQIDGGDSIALTNSGSYYSANISTESISNGAHYLRVIFNNSQMTTYRTCRIVIEKAGGAVASWRAQLTGSAKSSPILSNGMILVGSNDGKFTALDAASGNTKWTYQTGGEILSTPAIGYGNVYFGSGDGNLYAITLEGKFKWKYKADSAIYSSPCITNDAMIYFGSKKGVFYGLDARDGAYLWKNTSATYCIEDQPSEENGIVYYSAWDGFVYAVDSKIGRDIWHMHNAGSEFRAKAKKYYSAADSNPVLTQSTSDIYITDRDWQLSAMNKLTGTISWHTTNSMAVSASEDGKSLYVRTLDGENQLQKWSLNGNMLWAAPVKLNNMENGHAIRYPAPAVEKNGKVYSVSGWGTLYALDAKSGKVLWQYQTTPQLAVLSTPFVDDKGTVYVSAMDGTVTAVIGPK